MKVLKFIMFLFYRYYSKGGTKNIPYFSALCAVVFLFYVHVFQLLIVLNKVYILGLNNKEYLRIEKYGKLALFLLPVFLLVSLLVKPGDLIIMRHSEEKIERGNKFLVMYVVGNISLLFLLMLLVPKK